jgi:outer membrane biosynthesis protein TonB
VGTQIASVEKVNITSAPPKIKGESAGKGTRTQAAINRVVSRQQSRLKKVYESMLKRDPNLGGKLVVKFIIMPDASVTSVAIVKSTTGNPTFDKRIVSYSRGIPVSCSIVEDITAEKK